MLTLEPCDAGTDGVAQMVDGAHSVVGAGGGLAGVDDLDGVAPLEGVAGVAWPADALLPSSLHEAVGVGAARAGPAQGWLHRGWDAPLGGGSGRHEPWQALAVRL